MNTTSNTQEQRPRGGRRPRKLVLCFDGTGNKFRGDDSDSNILKIFRMLDRTASDQYHYYQPGIGTYVVSNNLSHTSMRARIKAQLTKAKDSAIGSSFDQHVVGGYRFLMRFYSPGDHIFIFGFSRGAYIARFLAEMIDYVGLLSHGNEEMVAFAWRAFAQWQRRRGGVVAVDEEDPEDAGDEGEQQQQATIRDRLRKKKAKIRAREEAEKARRRTEDMYTFLKGFRETFSRPVRRIRFLGLFDTVNSVPQFEAAWMERQGTQFPYTARSSAKVIRHAVSIDERRAKFRQDLIYQSRGEPKEKDAPEPLAHARQKLHHMCEKYRGHHRARPPPAFIEPKPEVAPPAEAGHRGRRPSQMLDGEDDRLPPPPRLSSEHPERFRNHSHSRTRPQSQATRGSTSCVGDEDACGTGIIPDDEYDDEDSSDESDQDIDEVWFAGGHGDVGGGWSVQPGSHNASHVPLAWMVREAMRAGLSFDMDKVVAMGCAEGVWEADPRVAAGAGAGQPPVPKIRVNSGATFSAGQDATGSDAFKTLLSPTHTAPLHDSLSFSCATPPLMVLSWRLMEYLPFRRMDLQRDGTWRPIRWPLPRGETRDMPADARVHGSVVRRMRADAGYRPGNLIVGGGGRGCRVAPSEYGIGDWVCVKDEGDPIGEIWVRKAGDA